MFSKRRRLLLRELHIAELALAEERDLASLALVAEHDDLLTGRGYVRQTLDLDWDRRAGLRDRIAHLIEHRADAAEGGTGQHDVPAPERSRLNEHGRNRAAAFVEPRLDHDALGGGIHGGGELKNLGLKQQLLEQGVYALAGLCRYRHEWRVPAILLGDDALRHQLLLHFFRVGLVLVDLVDRDDHGDLGGLGVIDRLYGLGHDSVVGRNDKNHDIRHLGASRAHRREGLVAGRIQESDHASGRLHVIGADVLRDAARLARGDLGAADVVEERSLAVVHVSHHSHDRSPRLELRFVALGHIGQQRFGIIEFRRPGDVAQLGDDDHRSLLVEHLVDRDHVAELHERLDDFRRLDRHLVGELSHSDGFRHHDLADDRLCRRAERLRALRGRSPGRCLAPFGVCQPEAP